MDLGAKDVYQPKAGPESEREKSRTFMCWAPEATPSCVRYRLMCSTVVVLSLPLNLEKSGVSYFGGGG